MFNWLRNKEKNIASTAIAMFVGSWLLLFCQTCIATSQDAGSIGLSQNKTEYLCHTIENEPDKTVEYYNIDGDHCLGACDCDDVPALLNSAETVKSSDKYKNIFFYDNLVAVSNESGQENVQATYPIAIFPEQAILLPLKHFTVLLI